MSTRSALRTRLQARLGLGVVSPVEQTRLNEALNSGLARALSDGVPGLILDTFVGATHGTLSASDTVDTAVGSSVVTLASSTVITDNVFPNDILVIVSSGVETKFIIREVLTETTVDIGVPAPVVINGDDTSYIIRRAIELPGSGQVFQVGRISGGDKVTYLSRSGMNAKARPFATGTAQYFEQRYSELQAASYVSLWPAPNDTSERFLISHADFKVALDDDADTLLFPDEALDAILERARHAYLTWIGSADATQLSASGSAVRDTDDILKNTSDSAHFHQRA